MCLVRVLCFTPEPSCYVLPCLSTQSRAQNTCQALTLLWVHSWGSQAPQGAPGPVVLHPSCLCGILPPLVTGGTGEDMECWVLAT